MHKNICKIWSPAWGLCPGIMRSAAQWLCDLEHVYSHPDSLFLHRQRGIEERLSNLTVHHRPLGSLLWTFSGPISRNSAWGHLRENQGMGIFFFNRNYVRWLGSMLLFGHLKPLSAPTFPGALFFPHGWYLVQGLGPKYGIVRVTHGNLLNCACVVLHTQPSFGNFYAH